MSCGKAHPRWLSGWAEEQAQRNRSAQVRVGSKVKSWGSSGGAGCRPDTGTQTTQMKNREGNATISDMVREKNLADVFQLNCMPERSWQVSAATHGPHKHFTSCLFIHGWETQQTTSANNEVTESLCRALHCQVQENFWNFLFIFFVPF